MDKLDLRTILLKLQDRLTDDDRRRLHFFLGNNVPRRIQDDLSLNGTLRLIESLFDQDKINEQDMTLLINAFNEIQCTDIAQILKQHMKQVQSNEFKKSTENLMEVISPTTAEDNENCSLQNVLIDQNSCDNNNLTIHNSNTNINPLTVVLNNPTKFPLRSKRKHLVNKLPIALICLLLFILLYIILTGVVIDDSFKIIQLRNKYDNILNEHAKNNEIIQSLKYILSKYNETIQRLSEKEQLVEEKPKITIGTTCGCDKWCSARGSPYGVCGNGHTCICSKNPIIKEYVANECTCDTWCRKYGYKNGGICGDGYTCICSS